MKNLGRFSIVPILLALTAGCVSPRYHTVRCVTPEQLQRLKSAEPPKVGQSLTGDAREDYKIAAGSAVRLRAWGEGLLNVLGGCQG